MSKDTREFVRNIKNGKSENEILENLRRILKEKVLKRLNRLQED